MPTAETSDPSHSLGSRRSRAFGGKSPNNYGFQYWNNKKAWFNNGIFVDRLRAFDNDMRQQGRQVILLMDNFPAHKKALETISPTNVRSEFFAPNLTSHCQPLDQGKIRAFKAHFHIQKTRHTIKKLDSKDPQPWQLSIREAMSFAKAAWESVKDSTCLNCFRHAGIMPGHARTTASAPAVETRDTIEAQSEGTGRDKAERAWKVNMRAFDFETSIPDIIKQLEGVMGSEFNLPDWQTAVNLTCYEDDDAREENRSAAESLKRDRLRAASDAAPAAANPATPLSVSGDRSGDSIPVLLELEAALGLALMQAGCSEGQTNKCVAELLDDVTEEEAEATVEVVAMEEDQLMEDIIKRVKADGILVTEIFDDESDDEDVMDSEVSQYAGDLTESLLTQINSALDTLLKLGTARPEEEFASGLVSSMHSIKKWSNHMHFQLPLQQPSIKTFFSKQPTAAEESTGAASAPVPIELD